jgi:uncharacterized protein (AIM24 family)
VALRSSGASGGVEEEFLYHMNRGTDLLGQGETEAAKAALERAFELRPKDPKALGLLGQAYYKLSRFEQAAEVYGKLVDDNPVEPAARINLGLACLKARRYPEAIRQLGIALDINPDHKKALGYLGLAYLEAGEVAKAREHFVRAGSEAMIQRCDELLAVAPQPEPLPTPAPAQPARRAKEAAPAEPPPTRDVGPAPPTLVQLAAAKLIHPARGAPFAIDPALVTVTVSGEMVVRTDGLFAVHGSPRMAGEMKRFRGRSTDQHFGEGAQRMFRVVGQGVLYYEPGGRTFSPIDLGSEAGYFREQVIFAMEDTVIFENGRVPSRAADLLLVHLRGRGRFLLLSHGDPVAMDVTSASPLRVPMDALLGWHGALTPKVVAMVETPALPAGAPEPPPPPDAAINALVELSGEGRVLLDPIACKPMGRFGPGMPF